MAIHDEIAAETPGALFRRGGLHIHSFGEFGSYAVKDAGMTPESIVDMAVAENLRYQLAEHATSEAATHIVLKREDQRDA